jgi:hypothetical protein
MSSFLKKSFLVIWDWRRLSQTIAAINRSKMVWNAPETDMKRSKRKKRPAQKARPF